MPIDRPLPNSGTPRSSPDGSLLGWLAVNYPDTYARLANQPHDTSRAREPKGNKPRKKRRITSPTTQTQDAANRPISTRTRA